MANNKRDYYEVLGVSKGASDEELKEMYTSFASFWKCQVNDNYAK